MGEPVRLYVGNLNFRTVGQDLNEFFSQFGPVEDAVVIMERDDPMRSRGFGFVTYANMELAQAAIQKSDGVEFMGRSLRVNVAQNRDEGGGGSGGGGRGGFGGGGRGGGGYGGGRGGGGRGGYGGGRGGGGFGGGGGGAPQGNWRD